MSTPPANGETKRWNIEAIPLDELNLLALSFEAGGIPAFEDCVTRPFGRRACRPANNHCRL